MLYRIPSEHITLTTKTEDSWGVDSIAYFCSTCGKVWGEIIAGKVWHVQATPCRQHTPTGAFDWGEVPGSMLNAMLSKDFVGRWAWAACIESLPPALYLRELEVHINHVERKYHESESEVLSNSVA